MRCSFNNNKIDLLLIYTNYLPIAYFICCLYTLKCFCYSAIILDLCMCDIFSINMDIIMKTIIDFYHNLKTKTKVVISYD